MLFIKSSFDYIFIIVVRVTPINGFRVGQNEDNRILKYYITLMTMIQKTGYLNIEKLVLHYDIMWKKKYMFVYYSSYYQE